MIHTLDLLDRAPRVIASFLLETSEGPVVLETGPESRFEVLESALHQHGYAVRDVRHVFVTHIHLDHAGAAWRFAEHGATVYVHPKGAPHLIDPGKLWASATRIYGDQMEALWGRMGHVPPAQVRALEDRERVRIGEFTIEALDTPGHANHHHAYRIDSALVAGDVAGVRIGRGPVLPPCPPPEIHVETWQQSLARLRGLGLQTLYLTHFGPVTDVQSHLAALEARLLDWADWMRRRLKAGKTRDEIVSEFEAYVAAELHAAGLNDEEVREYEYADPAWMSVDGLIRYWSKHHPKAIARAV
jgi:glyoxylase-like metal-dependent hydrolase (beta-lactamase superfamily II)